MLDFLRYDHLFIRDKLLEQNHSPAKMNDGRIKWKVAKGFLTVIYVECPSKKTNVAMNAILNYSACIRYTQWMSGIEWLHNQPDGKINLIDAGRQICVRLLPAREG